MDGLKELSKITPPKLLTSQDAEVYSYMFEGSESLKVVTDTKSDYAHMVINQADVSEGLISLVENVLQQHPVIIVEVFSKEVAIRLLDKGLSVEGDTRLTKSDIEIHLKTLPDSPIVMCTPSFPDKD